MSTSVPISIVAPFQRALATNSTSTSLAAKTPTTTKPSGSGIFTTPHGVRLIVIPYGRDTNNDVIQCRIGGWRQVAGLWIHTTLAVLNATLSSTLVGVAGEQVTDNDYLPDSIDRVTGDTSYVKTLPGEDDVSAAAALVDMLGNELIEFDFDISPSGETAGTQANALFAPLN